VLPTNATDGQAIPGYDLLTQYGQISLANIKAATEGYQFLQGRNAQKVTQKYEFLYSSLNNEAQARIALKENDYYIIEPGALTTNFANGPLFLKTIIDIAHIDVRSTAVHICPSLSMLQAKIASLDYDISKFNEYVKLQWGALLARGEVPKDLLFNIFATFFVFPDITFKKAYIDRVKDLYDEGDEHMTKD
jgi:hypothetical protein